MIKGFAQTKTGDCGNSESRSRQIIVSRKHDRMENSEIIVSGPEFKGEEFLGSFAEFVIPRIKAIPKDSIAQVDVETNESITSHEFLKASVEVAEGLIDLGLKKGDVVVHACPNYIRSVTAAIGTILAGGVLTPVDRYLKPMELQLLFKQFRPKFIICEMEKAEIMQQSGKMLSLEPKIIVINSNEDGAGDFLSWNDINKPVDIDNYVPRKVDNPKEDLAVISCSSGSTGLPKGVALSHFAIIYSYLINEDKSSASLFNKILLTSPLYWVSGVLFTLKSCISGDTRINPKSLNPDDLLEAIEKFGIVFLFISPSCLLDLINHPNFKKYDLSSMKLIITGGAPLAITTSEIIKTNWEGVALVQLYGLTELCGAVTNLVQFTDPITVGKLVPEMKMIVVDPETGKHVGPNVVGEARFKSKRIMRGYYNNEEATKSAFDENGWFRSGDHVYYNEEGYIYIVGRISEIIKYKNLQVSPNELEDFIIGLPGVQDVGVVGVPHETDCHHIKALVVKDSSSDITAETIIEAVRENFSQHKHLSAGVQFVNALPRSEVGKLKRRQLEKLIL